MNILEWAMSCDYGPCYNTIKLALEYTPTDYRLLMAGEYSTFDLYDLYDEEAFGFEPPDNIDYGSIL